MKKFILIITIFTLIFTMGCTQLPLSEETGLGPAEYEGIVNTEEIKKENTSLKQELDKTNEELEDLKNEYLSLAKSNESMIFKLEEAESKLQIVDSEDLPKFSTESTDKNSIISYLKDSLKLIDDSVKGIELIKQDDSIVFRTIGYGKEYSQIYIWTEGESEPRLIDGAVFDKEGSYEWLDKYILIKNNGKNKILDLENQKLIGSFDSPDKLLLLEGSTTVLLKYDDKFLLYDFINDSNKELKLDNNNYTDFNLKNNSLIFTGTYDDQAIEYEIRATITLGELKELYEVKSTEEVEEVDELEASQEGEDTV